MTRNVHKIGRTELLKSRNAKIIVLFFVLFNRLPNEMDLFIYNGIFFNEYTFGMAYMKKFGYTFPF